MAYDSNGIIAGLYGIQASMSLASAYSQSEALKMQGAYQKNQAEINARFLGLQAEDAIKRGDRAANEVRQKGKAFKGSQRAAAAAQGIDVNEGSALAAQIDTDQQVASDMLKVRNNAWREAWGLKTQASSVLSQGSFAQMAANNQASATLLTGGLNTVGAAAQGAPYAFKAWGPKPDDGGRTPPKSDQDPDYVYGYSGKMLKEKLYGRNRLSGEGY